MEGAKRAAAGRKWSTLPLEVSAGREWTYLAYEPPPTGPAVLGAGGHTGKVDLLDVSRPASP